MRKYIEGFITFLYVIMTDYIYNFCKNMKSAIFHLLSAVLDIIYAVIPLPPFGYGRSKFKQWEKDLS